MTFNSKYDIGDVVELSREYSPDLGYTYSIIYNVCFSSSGNGVVYNGKFKESSILHKVKITPIKGE